MEPLHCQKCSRFVGKTDSIAMVYCRPCKLWQTLKVDMGHVKAVPLSNTRVSA